MKKLQFLFLLIAIPCIAQTNYFWSANFTSNYIRNFVKTNLAQTNVTEYVFTQLTNNNNAITGSVPIRTLYSGITTNVPTIAGTNGSGIYVTNWFCITNGVLLRITNNVP